MPYRRPKNDSQYLWLRSAVIVFFIMMMRLLQQQAEAQNIEVFQPLGIDVIPSLEEREMGSKAAYL